MSGFYEFGELYAICNHMPGGDPETLRVGGVVRTRTDGYEASLKPRDGNDGINPLMLHLDLVLSGSGTGTEVITDEDIKEYEESEPVIEYTQVEIHVSPDDGGGSKVIEVVHPER